MKKLLLVSSLLMFSTICFAQQNDVPTYGINLEHVQYPFPVHYINLTIQGELLKMAFMDVQTQNTKAILVLLGIHKIYLFGHSMGGMLATHFTLMYPEVVEKLILENPIGLEDWKTKVPYQSVDEWYQEELKLDFAKIKNYQLVYYYGNKWKPEYDKWVNLFSGCTTDIDYPKIAWNSALMNYMIFTQPVCYESENIQTPTLLIIGQRDRTAIAKNKVPEAVRNNLGNYPLLGKQTAKKIKNSQLIELDNVGHLPHIEAYDRFITSLLTFLNQ